MTDRGAVIPVRIRTPEDGSAADVGDLVVQRGRVLAGQAVLPDGKAPPRGTILWTECPNAKGSLNFELDQTGRLSSKDSPTALSWCSRSTLATECPPDQVSRPVEC